MSNFDGGISDWRQLSLAIVLGGVTGLKTLGGCQLPTCFRRWPNHVLVTMFINLTVTRQQGRGLHFSTSDEAEYPWELVRKVVELVAKYLKYPMSLSQNSVKTIQMASSHKQHRKYKQLIPEFHSYVTSNEAPTLPSKLLDKRSSSGGASGSDSTMARYGIFHTKQQFLERSYKLEHPFDLYDQVDDLTRSNVFFALSEGPVKLSKRRLQSLIECETGWGARDTRANFACKLAISHRGGGKW